MNGNLISARTLMMDDYCKKCHADVHQACSKSQHHSEFLQQPGLSGDDRGDARRAARSGMATCKASRWCAGCHDPVPFLSGQFDNPELRPGQ